jgi:hypothetical protein
MASSATWSHGRRAPGRSLSRSPAAGRAVIIGLVRGQISSDLVMDDDMAFVEGTFRLGSGAWQVFIVSKGAVPEPEWRASTWQSGVTGLVFRVSRTLTLGVGGVEALLPQARGVEKWERVKGPRSWHRRPARAGEPGGFSGRPGTSTDRGASARRPGMQ